MIAMIIERHYWEDIDDPVMLLLLLWMTNYYYYYGITVLAIRNDYSDLLTDILLVN